MRETVCTPEVVAELADRMSCYQPDARELLEHFADLIVEAINEGKAVYFAPLGKFYPSRAVRARKDGKRCRTIRFRPSAGLKRKIKEENADEVFKGVRKC
ncbi:MAG: HU family DNA-binding protein [Syntrophaceticus sp.]|jgi:nucleoid DNA-binding protein